MSKLDELIQELCPDGVEYRAIKDIAWTGIGLATSVTKHKRNDGVVLIHNSDIMQNKITLKNFEFLDEDFVKKNENKIHKLHDIVTVHTGDVGTSAVIEQEFVGSIGFTTIITRIKDFSKVSPYYLCNYLNSQLFKSEVRKKSISERSNLNQKDYEVIQVPIPPLEVQQEIVRLLDDFTAKTAELQAELNKEYEARKKQYECYRDNLIRNELHISKVINLIDIADVYDSLHQTPSYSINGYNMVRVQDIKGGYINIDKTLKVEETVWKLFTQKYVPQPNDVVVSRVGSYGNFALIPDNQCCLGQNVALIHPKINPQYLYYVLTSTMTKQWINNNVKGTSQKSLSLADIKRVPIPVPNENNQKYIADILNNFNITMDELQLNISIELESRQKQYEFYRDKLLTFKELK